MTGQTLGHYHILEELGSGGMGTVFKARDTHLNRTVAIKVLRADVVADAGRKQRLIHEAHAASSLNHPNIVVIHDFAAENGIDYIVMEYVTGKTLDALIPRHGMRLGDALRIAAQMADGLANAHEAGIVHRDLKPSNVMVTENGRVKLLDFGVAKLVEAAVAVPDEPTVTRRPETEEGTVVGTVAYMSPEQAEGRKVDLRSDIFSFGSVLYEMVSGRRPFAGDSRLATLSAILKEEPKALEDVPPDIATIVRRCLRKDPSRRFQHMSDVKVAIDEVRESSETAGLATATRDRAKRRAPIWMWITGAAVVVVGVAGAAVWRQGRTAPQPATAYERIPLTSYPGWETQPTFSPDGRQVAFSWNGEAQVNYDIWVKLVDGDTPLQLTRDPSDDTYPTWSPDGRFIAFVRKNAIYTISPLGGVERKIVDAAATCLAWTPDGKGLAFHDNGPDAPSGIMLLNLETGQRRELTRPPAPGRDTHVAFSPDGKTVAYVRTASSLGSGEIQVLALPDGTPRTFELPNISLQHLAWTSDGRSVLVTVDRAGARTLWRASLDTGQLSPVPGLDDWVSAPVVSNTPPRLAYSRAMGDENIWGLSGGSASALITSTRRDFNPRLAPDGSRFAFVSDRTGGWEIYMSDLAGKSVAPLTSFGNLVVDGIRWAPQGDELSFAVLRDNNRDIYVMRPEGGPPRQLTTEISDDGRPSYSSDGQSIYFRSNRSGREEIWKMPRAGGPAVQVTREGAFEALESPDGKTLYFVRARAVNGLWRMPVEGGTAEPVPGLESVVGGRWDVTDDGMCYLASVGSTEPFQSSSSTVPGSDQVLVCWNTRSGKRTEMGAVHKPVWGAAPVFSASRNGRRFLWNQTDHLTQDLVLVENFR